MFFRTKKALQKSIAEWERRLGAATPEQADLNDPSSLQMLLEPTYRKAIDAFELWEMDCNGVLDSTGPDADYFDKWKEAATEHFDYLRSLI